MPIDFLLESIVQFWILLAGSMTIFAAVLKHPGFHNLDIAFLVGGIDDEEINWRPFRNGRLRRALEEAKYMEDMRLHTAVIKDPSDDRTRKGSSGSLRHFIPLQSIFPVEKWSKLRHFELSRFLVVQSDVISLLSALPETLRYVQLKLRSRRKSIMPTKWALRV